MPRVDEPINRYGRQVVARDGDLVLEVSRYSNAGNEWHLYREGPRGGKYPIYSGSGKTALKIIELLFIGVEELHS